MRGDRIRRPLTTEGAAEALDQLSGAGLNFEPVVSGELTAATGWRVDDHSIPLPPEPAGEPVPGGSWETARQLMTDYDFADPDIVRAVYRPEDPLEGRTMLLEGRFWWMRFRLGVRIGDVVDEVRTLDGRDARVWGWSYRTLEGHLEKGRMDYEVRKWLDSGEVDFRIHAYSKAGEIRSPLVRLGFALFGRHMQKKFVRHALRRMDRLVRARLLAASTGRQPPEEGELRSGHLRLDSNF